MQQLKKSKISYIWEMILKKGSFDEGYDPATANYFLANYIDTVLFASQLSMMNIPKELHYKLVEEKLKGTYRKKPPFQRQYIEEEPLIIIHAISNKLRYSLKESAKLVEYFTDEQKQKLIHEYENFVKENDVVVK